MPLPLWAAASLAGAGGFGLAKLFGGDKDKSAEEEAIRKAGETAYARGEATPEEEAQYKGSFGTGQQLQQIFKYLMGMGQAPGGYQGAEAQYQQGGPLAQEYYQQTLGGVQDPYAAYESQLQPALTQAEDYINRQAQGRGLIRSGIPIEQMGRAGVELAIKEAQDRMRFRGEELARGGELSQYGQGLQQQNLMNLSNLYGQQQQFGQGAMSRQASQALGTAGYQSYAPQAALGDIYGRQAAMYALPSQILGSAGQAVGAYYGAK